MPSMMDMAWPLLAVAAGAYINAKGAIGHDLGLLAAIASAFWNTMMRMRRGRLSLFCVLEDRARDPATAKRDFIIFQNRRHTYEAVYDRALRYGNYFRSQLGVKAGDVVAMDFMNSDTFIFVWWGLWSVGAVPAFINYNLQGEALAHSLRVSTASLCIVDAALSDFKGVEDLRHVVLTEETEREILSTPAVRTPVEVERDDPALLIYTSGTTGLPKAAVVTWYKLNGIALAMGKVVQCQGEIVYTPMPLYHGTAALTGVCMAVAVGGTLAIGRKFSSRTYWDDVRSSGATVLQYVGETMRYLLAAPPQYDSAGECLDKKHSVKKAFGNGLRPDVWNKFKDRFGVDTIHEFYSATEAPGATFNYNRNDFSVGAVSRRGWLLSALFDSNFAIVEMDWDSDVPLRDPATGMCRKVKAGEAGQLLMKLPEDVQSAFRGYHNNEKATNGKIMRDALSKGDAWFLTGDIMKTDAEGKGLLFFVDRSGDTYRWKSENVATFEVGHAVGEHPHVREANVYGVLLPNHDGRAGCVAICFDCEDPTRPPAPLLRSLADHLRARLPSYAVPIFLRVVPDVGADTTGTNKQQKVALREAGVSPEASKGNALYMLWGDTYVPFGRAEWQDLEGGRLKL